MINESKKRIVIIGGISESSESSLRVDLPHLIENYLNQYGEIKYISLIEDYQSLSRFIKDNSQPDIFIEYFYFPTTIPKKIKSQINSRQGEFINLLTACNSTLGYLEIVEELGYLYVKSIHSIYRPNGIFFENNIVAQVDWHFFAYNIAQKTIKRNRREIKKQRRA
jgi:hypothetical protein